MKILFFTPSLARTGSEISLYNLICNANRQEIKMAVAVGTEGELSAHLPDDVQLLNYNGFKAPSPSPRLSTRLLKKFSKTTKEYVWLEELARDYEGYIWYVNTICQPQILRQARKFGVPCVLHSHELESMLMGLAENDIADIVEYPKLIIACSKAAEGVLRQLGRKENLEVLYPPIDLKRIVSSPQKSEKVREKLNIDKDTFVWVMSGVLDPNKNALLFIELVQEMTSRGHKVHFVWIGSGMGRGYKPFVEGTARYLNVADRISWVGPRSEDYYDYLQAADGFVLTSFRESFSMVTVEAAYLGKPVVAFDCGGVKEIIKDGMGVIVNSWNRADLVTALESAMKGEINFDPDFARKEVSQFDAPRQAIKWQSILGSYFGDDRV
jgi:glycosyltransferase involved in cell wall biosynthesis